MAACAGSAETDEHSEDANSERGVSKNCERTGPAAVSIGEFQSTWYPLRTPDGWVFAEVPSFGGDLFLVDLGGVEQLRTAGPTSDMTQAVSLARHGDAMVLVQGSGHTESGTTVGVYSIGDDLVVAPSPVVASFPGTDGLVAYPEWVDTDTASTLLLGRSADSGGSGSNLWLADMDIDTGDSAVQDTGVLVFGGLPRRPKYNGQGIAFGWPSTLTFIRDVSHEVVAIPLDEAVNFQGTPAPAPGGWYVLRRKIDQVDDRWVNRLSITTTDTDFTNAEKWVTVDECAGSYEACSGGVSEEIWIESDGGRAAVVWVDPGNSSILNATVVDERGARLSCIRSIDVNFGHLAGVDFRDGLLSMVWENFEDGIQLWSESLDFE